VGLLGAELLELVGKNADALQWARMAYAAASELGDDSRRGRVAARAGRALALSGQLETARELAEAALAIGMRLDLPAIEADALASLGLLEVVGTNSAAATESALEPLRRAAGLYRQLRRRPRLLMTLCDLVRAEFYAGTTERFEAALTELDELTPAFPGLEPHARLTKVELLRHAGAHEEARQEAGRLLESARDTQNEWAAEKARRALAPTDATPGEEAQ
jgi:tetratricopeptide (TPR) repeat protein